MIYSVLAGNSNIWGYLPMATVCFCAVVLFVALCIGLKKGGRRVSWSGLVWLIAGGGFLLADKFLLDKLPLENLFARWFKDDSVVAFACSFTLALGCILIALLLYGICTVLYRPKARWKEKTEDIFIKDEYGIEYDDDYKDYDDYEDYQNRKVLVRKGYGKPSGFGRLCGGVICVVNTAMVLLTVLAVAVFILSATRLKTGVLATMYTVPAVIKFESLAAKYALDFALIGIIVCIACAGRRKGMIQTLRGLILGVGIPAAIAISFYLPFSRFAAEDGVRVLYGLVSRSAGAFEKLGASEKVAGIIAKILSGVLLAGLFAAVLWLVGFLLKALANFVDGVGFLRAVDGALSCLVFMIIGVLVCAVVWALIYVLGYYGVFTGSDLFAGETSLSKGLLDVCNVYLRPYLERFSEIAPNWFAKIPF